MGFRILAIEKLNLYKLLEVISLILSLEKFKIII